MLAGLAQLALPPAAADGLPRVVISQAGQTLRLQEMPHRQQVFPAGLGRRCADCSPPPRGTFYTGPDPQDPELYLPARHEPEFHRGLPFLRLLGTGGSKDGGAPALAIHGPVTPSLIWGEVSAGCVRLRPADLRALFAVARRHPGLPVRFISGPDPHAERVLAGRRRSAGSACPESGVGARRLRRLALGQVVRDRLCGGVDHWFALELSGGDQLAARLQQAGGLRLELYGIRGISAVRQGRHAIDYAVPRVARNRGDRYLRVLSPRDSAAPQSYSLVVEIGGGPGPGR